MKSEWFIIILMIMAFKGELVRLSNLEPLLSLRWLVQGDEVQYNHVI